ncbi:hypothetical protein D3C76_688420 [compost metagenome]
MAAVLPQSEVFSVLLPVPQFKESHDCEVDLTTVGDAGATVVAPPYRAMSVGDTVTFTLKRFFDDGVPWEDFTRRKVLVDGDIGQPLQWTVPLSELQIIDGGSALMSYSVVYATPTVPTLSDEQALRFVAPQTPLLPAPRVKGFTGDMLDPEAYPNGIKLVIEIYPGIQVEDEVVLYASGDPQVIKTLRVDPSTVDSQVLEVDVDYEWLGDEIEPVDEPHEGMPVSDREKWRSRLVENRFDLAEPRVATQDNSPSAAISRIDIYLHTRDTANAVKTFHAKFQKDRPTRWIKSTDYTDPNSKIEITPRAIPQFQPSDYEFERVRVDGGSGGPGDPEDDDFDFHLRTVDYWKLRYVGNLVLSGTAFEALEFVSVDANDVHMSISTSTIRWESEQLAETMFSWTGYIFKDPLKGEPLDKVKFDDALKDVVKDESLDIDVNSSVFEDGLLVISLHRSDRIPYIRQGNQSRDKLSRDLAVMLFDKRGNPHIRRISFLPPSTVGDRNRLVHSLFTPAQ